MSSGENSPRNYSSADEELGLFDTEKELKLEGEEVMGKL
jgi:hypothetical protein